MALLSAEVVALLSVLGFLPGQGPVWYNAFWAAMAFGILVGCDLLAAYMALCVTVTRSPPKY